MTRINSLTQVDRLAPAEIICGVAAERSINLKVVFLIQTKAGKEKPVAIGGQFGGEFVSRCIDVRPEILSRRPSGIPVLALGDPQIGPSETSWPVGDEED